MEKRHPQGITRSTPQIHGPSEVIGRYSLEQMNPNHRLKGQGRVYPDPSVGCTHGIYGVQPWDSWG